MSTVVEPTKPVRSKFQKHFTVLLWKSYLQRQRRWRILVLEMVFAFILFLVAVFIAKPVFLTPLDDEPQPPLSFADILDSLQSDTILGYAPDNEPYKAIMDRTAEMLGAEILSAATEDELNLLLYNRSQGNQIVNKVIWIIWEPKEGHVYRVRIRSTEVARYYVLREPTTTSIPANPHLRAGFLAVQLAISQSVLEFASPTQPEYELSLVSMPVSPLMQQAQVRRAISLILLCFTLALLPPVLETEALVVTESTNRYKRALRIRNVDFSSMYIGWLSYAVLTFFPICLMGGITLILIFRWVQLFSVQLILMAYVSLMQIIAMIMAMFHNKAKISCVWSTLQTLLQTLLAELMVHHKYDEYSSVLSFIVQMFLPPLGLLNGLNNFALLQTGNSSNVNSVIYTVLSWMLLIFLYFLILMLLQRTIGSQRAIGGQVSWKAIIFKEAHDVHKLRPVVHPVGVDDDKVQKVDELVAKAVSFRDVSKKIMGVPVLLHVTFDIYRGEYTYLLSERIQDKMLSTCEDLLTGLTFPDSGQINILGVDMGPHRNLMTEPAMMGYCDRSSYLIDDLTVEEHLTFYTQISLWNESNETVSEYEFIRSRQLLQECELGAVANERADRLGVYYRAQLCWAVAVLLEPRIVVVPNYDEDAVHMAVIRDKIIQYKKYITIVKIALSSLELEYADRLFLLDTKILAFGGTPAYMFYKFGREYRIRLSFKTRHENDEELKAVVRGAGAAVRAHLGSLLILRMPTTPTANVAQMIEHLHDNKAKYGIISMNISLADPEEVFRRAIHESRVFSMSESNESKSRSKWALTKVLEPRPWTRKKTMCGFMMQLRIIGWKYFTFYIYYRFVLIVTVISVIVAGVFIGLSLANMLKNLELKHDRSTIMYGEELTVEAMKFRTTLVMRLDNSSISRSLGHAYVMSTTKANPAAVKRIKYMALHHSESLVEYLVTQAIDSPQHYVSQHAYGMDVAVTAAGLIRVQALYSPLHRDQGAAARSLARAYMALLRYYTGRLDASIQFINDPLVLDLTPWMVAASEPPLLIQFLLVLTISHMTLVPSKEFGLVRHMQSHAMNFSPVRYWFSLAICDLIHYWILVILMSGTAFVIILLIVPQNHFHYEDLMAVPFMLIVYGVGCVPQAYLFSLGPRAPLNSMALVIVNIVFGEATIIAKLFYGNAYDFAVNFMTISPQYNMTYAFVKIRQLFLYNSECIIYKAMKFCSSKVLHKCCSKCGILQDCFKKRAFLWNIKREIFSILGTAALFMCVLLLWEYRVIALVWTLIVKKIMYRVKPDLTEDEMGGAARERYDVVAKQNQIELKKRFQNITLDTFGDNLLVVNVSRVINNYYEVRNVYLGLGRGETLALSGMKRHGRLKLCEAISGYKSHDEGHLWAMSKYRLRYSPHNYLMNVALCCERNPLPSWMTVYDGLEMLAVLRGVPVPHVHLEVKTLINALDLWQQEDLLVCRLQAGERRRLSFAAAAVGAPPVLVLDECSAYQDNLVKRAMNQIIYSLRKKGHSILHSAYNVETHMAVTNRLAIIRDGRIFDIDHIDSLLERYSNIGITVVIHLKDDVDIGQMFSKYFKRFTINDTTDVLANVQILDVAISWTEAFKAMERLMEENQQVYSYIICAKPIDYIYKTIISDEKGFKRADDLLSRPFVRKLFAEKKIEPREGTIENLKAFEKKYDITSLKELPWSVIFHR